jgi:hypothetical protein
MAKTFDLYPEPTRIRILAGTTLRLNCRPKYDTGAQVDLTSATFETSIFARTGTAPVVTTFATALLGDGRVQLSLTASETELIPGSWGISATATIGSVVFALLRGDLTVVEP